jgi:phthalate 4,5-dioxygenase
MMKKSAAGSTIGLCRVGGGTPAGEWFRRYWMVVETANELRDFPIAVHVLDEPLLLFRDRADGIGLLGLHCPRRGASLEYGDIEARGLRCPYHGWLFDRTGTCLEMPAEPGESRFHTKVEHRSYPARELGGLLFAYLGQERADPPPLPRYRALAHPAGQRSIEPTRVYEYNWFNFIENGADPAHFSILIEPIPMSARGAVGFSISEISRRSMQSRPPTA